MSAADVREELEALVHIELARAAKHGITAGAEIGRRLPFQVILTAVDRYAEAVADERIAGRVASISQGRERLAEAADSIAAQARIGTHCTSCGYKRSSQNHATICRSTS